MFIKLDDVIYPVIIKHKNIKNIYLKMDDNYNIIVSAPKNIKEDTIYKILKENQKKIINWKEKIEKRKKINKGFYYLGEKSAFLKLNSLDPNFDIDAWYKNQAEIIFKERLDKIFSHFEEKIPYPKLKIKKLKSKWGSCSIKTNSITLNQELIKYSIDIIDYVIIHELCHFIISNHSKHFWKYVKKYSPNYKDLRKNLRKGLIK